MPGLTVTWGDIRDWSSFQEAIPTSAEELGDLLDRLHAEALARAEPRRVSVWPSTWKRGDDGYPDPFIQILLGHPERGSVQWREGDDSWHAVDPALPALPDQVVGVAFGPPYPFEPEATRIAAGAPRRILLAYERSGERSPDVTWARRREPLPSLGREDQATDERKRELRELAEAAARELRSAGLPVTIARGLQSVRGGAEVTIDENNDLGQGVFVTWQAGEEVSDTAVTAYAAGDVDHPALRHNGVIDGALVDAMLAILVSAGFPARLSEDDMMPYTIKLFGLPPAGAPAWRGPASVR